MGIDLSEFYKSVEWDILGVPAARFFKIFNENIYKTPPNVIFTDIYKSKFLPSTHFVLKCHVM